MYAVLKHRGEKDKEDVLPPESQGEKNKDEIDYKDPIICLPEQTSDNRYCEVLYINYKSKFFTITVAYSYLGNACTFTHKRRRCEP